MALSDNTYVNFWPCFTPSDEGSRLLFNSMSHKTIGSVFGENRHVDVIFSGEAIIIRHNGEHFIAERGENSYSAKYFIGIPKILHPDALHVPLFYFYWANYLSMCSEHPLSDCNKSFGVSAVISNQTYGNLAVQRVRLMHELSLLVPVHANIALRAEAPPWSKVTYHEVPDKLQFISQYTHNLCFENVEQEGYLTEKIFDSFFAGCVPLYDGDTSASDWFPNASFINCRGLSALTIAKTVADRKDLVEIVGVGRQDLCRVPLRDMAKRIDEFSTRIMS